MVKRVDLGVEETVTQYVDGTFEGGSILDLGLAVGGVGLTEFEHTRGEIPDEFVTQIDEIRQMIIDGEIEIWNVIEQGYPDFFSES
jgi:basic membrane protein A